MCLVLRLWILFELFPRMNGEPLFLFRASIRSIELFRLMIDVDHLSPLDRVGRLFYWWHATASTWWTSCFGWWSMSIISRHLTVSVDSFIDDMRLLQLNDLVVSADDRCLSSFATWQCRSILSKFIDDMQLLQLNDLVQVVSADDRCLSSFATWPELTVSVDSFNIHWWHATASTQWSSSSCFGWW